MRRMNAVLNIDFLLGYLKGLLVKRNDLKLIITSATIDTGAFSRALNDAPIIEVSGRLVSRWRWCMCRCPMRLRKNAGT